MNRQKSHRCSSSDGSLLRCFDWVILFLCSNNAFYFFPKIALSIVLPILRSNPCLLNGIPVSLAIFCFA